MMREKGVVRVVIGALAIFVALSMTFIGASVVLAAQKDKPIVLRAANGLPESNTLTQVMPIPWMKAVEKATGGRVKFDVYYSGTLYKIQDLPDGLQSKGIDIAIVMAPQYTPSRFPYTDVQQLPFGPETAAGFHRATKIFMKNDHFLKQYRDNNIVPLVNCLTPPYLISTTKKKLAGVADFKGLRLRAGNQSMAWFEEELGMTPVFMPGAELAGALQRGVVDGTLLYAAFWASAGVQDMLKYTVKNFSFGSFYSNGIAIRKDVFESLPADIQEIMKKEADRVEIQGHKDYDKREAELKRKYIQEHGANFYDLPAGATEKMNEAGIQVWQKWIKEKEKKGFKHARDIAIAWKNALESTGVKLPEGIIPPK